MSKPGISADSRGLYIAWTPQTGGDLQQVVFDVTVSDEVDKVLDVTDHPVETGGDISDNARKRMDRFSFEVIVSDTPIIDQSGFVNSEGGQYSQTPLQVPIGQRVIPLNPLGAITELAEALTQGVTTFSTTQLTDQASYNALNWDVQFDRVGDMLTLLDSFQTNVNLLKIVTSKYSFDNVLLTGIKQMRDKDIGSGARYRLEFKQIRLVTLEFTNAPTAAEPRGNPPVNQGSKSSQQLPAGPKESVAADLFDTGAALFKHVTGL